MKRKVSCEGEWDIWKFCTCLGLPPNEFNDSKKIAGHQKFCKSVGEYQQKLDFSRVWYKIKCEV